MPTPDLCTEDEVSQLVHTYYDSVRDDPVLGPISKHAALPDPGSLPQEL